MSKKGSNQTLDRTNSQFKSYHTQIDQNRSNIIEKIVNSKEGKHLKFKIQKKLRYETHLMIYKIHRSKDSVPSSMF